MTFANPTLAAAAEEELKPRAPGRPARLTGKSVSVPPHFVGTETVTISLSEQLQKQLALYCEAFSDSFGRAPNEDQLLQDLITLGIQTDENYKAWLRDRKRKIAQETIIDGKT
ncbi:MAG: hypothetical protein RJS97_04990 [Parvibaculaceae bacterium]